MNPVDIVSTLQALQMLKYWKGKHLVLKRQVKCLSATCSLLSVPLRPSGAQRELKPAKGNLPFLKEFYSMHLLLALISLARRAAFVRIISYLVLIRSFW